MRVDVSSGERHEGATISTDSNTLRRSSSVIEHLSVEAEQVHSWCVENVKTLFPSGDPASSTAHSSTSADGQSLGGGGGSHHRVRHPEREYKVSSGVQVDAPTASADENAGGAHDCGDGAVWSNEPAQRHVLEEDVWSEEHIQYSQLLKTAFFEILPGPLGWASARVLEGKTSAWNRFVIDGDIGFLIFNEVALTSTMFFVILLLWWLDDVEIDNDDASADAFGGVHWSDIATLGLLKLYRYFGIALKYAYFTDSELACVRGTQSYGLHGVVLRRLGGAMFHDDQGTAAFDNLERLLESALRNECAEDFVSLSFDFGNRGPSAVARVSYDLTAKTMLRLDSQEFYDTYTKAEVSTPFPTLPFAQQQNSKYGNLRKLMRLDRGSIEGSIRDSCRRHGRLPVRVAAYVLVNIAYAVCAMPNDMLVWAVGAAIVPFVRWAQMDLSPFGDTALSNAACALLIYQKFFMLSIFIGFLYYPYYDAHRRWRLSSLLLAIFARDARARCAIATLDDAATTSAMRQLCPADEDRETRLSSAADVRSFWVLCRVLSPTYCQQIMLRYSNGFSLLSLLYLSGCCALVVLQVSTTTSRSSETTHQAVAVNTSSSNSVETNKRKGELYWPLIWEMAYIFVIVAVSLVMTILYGSRCNENFRRLAHACRRVQVRTATEHLAQDSAVRTDESQQHQSTSQLATEYAEDLIAHFEELPFRFLYQTADKTLVNALYAYVSFLLSAVFAALVANGHIDFGLEMQRNSSSSR
ncbi:unnamed protein product [Amoebophrya sp. A25]|nr:unnamed protein product [Amoebophrya sp. A25]|eukprot:GSA25T00001927001.1